ncbi:hypothetical protein FZEAL_10428 [Fusarium zealandicum]|uniref:Uncharacterized protein n=1 Tax=Fusarium zealandicum TaxID=1053134 RepID=A0A8H4U1W9_9HYPO|nr:hypothetical protein FZEAL_10428 [Fusarium zealandicum]
MESLHNGLDSRASSRSRLSTSAKVLAKARRKRPAISAPIGPIKNSRGADFARSDTFIVVPCIKDCESNESLPEKENIEAKKTTRRISASFSTRGPLASIPTVAKSDFNATTTRQPSAETKPVPKGFSFRKASKVRLTSSSSFSIFPSLETIVQDENVPPPDHPDTAPSTATFKASGKSRLPKSRTMSVLSEIKTSMSRPSLNARTANFRAMGDQSHQASSSPSNTHFVPSSSRIRLPRPSLTSASRSSSSSSTETTTQPDPKHITAAQNSAYWSGRFMSLQDRFLAADFEDEMDASPRLPFFQPIQNKAMTHDRQAVNSRPTHLSHSTTTSALTSLTSSKPRIPPGIDDDTRCLRIFRRLDGFCATNEARRSLHDWQQAYARRMNRPCLLPQGGRMEEKSLMGKIFGNGPRKSERRSLSGSSAPAVKKTKPTPAVGGRGKRLTLN